ncbi:unnamed protein product [Notodromas monacha]|uniref:Membralin n=1 Tax=Notodromas monacha TaxID=399045 RepID=A0A7R9BVU9_9CRUS|nr:unnamed protein product [Notodromas monacha]CAG0921177.1 unnamed protein product [Notodromas monacha]
MATLQPNQPPTAGNEARQPTPNPVPVGARPAAATVRDRIFHAIFFRVACQYAQVMPKSMRRFVEFFVLMKALFLLSMLAYMHIIFSRSPTNCLDHIKDTWPRDGILRVEIAIPPGPKSDIPVRTDEIRVPDEVLAGKSKHDLATLLGHRSSGVTVSDVCPARNVMNDSIGIGQDANHDVAKVRSSKPVTNGIPGAKSFLETILGISINSGNNFESDSDDPESSAFEGYVVEYSLEYGFLRLPASVRKRLGIPVMVARLNPREDACFGDQLSKWILERLLGYDDVLMASVKSIAEGENSKGYVRNVVTGEHFRFVSTWVTQTSYLAAAIIMILFVSSAIEISRIYPNSAHKMIFPQTLGISMLLRYSHHQIFVFIVDLLNMLEFNVSISFPAAPLFTVILALVGMEAIMSEFFNDTSTAFYIILIVWMADQYDAICCHAAITKRHWLRFFYLYHFAFYAYHYRYNGLYSGLALVRELFQYMIVQSLRLLRSMKITDLVPNFLGSQNGSKLPAEIGHPFHDQMVNDCYTHSMLYFFHHYELPLILQHVRFAEMVRSGLSPNSASASGAAAVAAAASLSASTQANEENSALGRPLWRRFIAHHRGRVVNARVVGTPAVVEVQAMQEDVEVVVPEPPSPTNVTESAVPRHEAAAPSPVPAAPSPPSSSPSSSSQDKEPVDSGGTGVHDSAS